MSCPGVAQDWLGAEGCSSVLPTPCLGAARARPKGKVHPLLISSSYISGEFFFIWQWKKSPPRTHPEAGRHAYCPTLYLFLQIVGLSLFSTLKLWSLYHHPEKKSNPPQVKAKHFSRKTLVCLGTFECWEQHQGRVFWGSPA